MTLKIYIITTTRIPKYENVGMVIMKDVKISFNFFAFFRSLSTRKIFKSLKTENVGPTLLTNNPTIPIMTTMKSKKSDSDMK